MGLGKTYMVTALMTAQRLRAQQRTLIVVPDSSIADWRTAVQNMMPTDIGVRIVKGGNQVLHTPDLSDYGVVITTYTALQSYDSQYKKSSHAKAAARRSTSRKRKKDDEDSESPPIGFASIVWDRIVLDEAHAIKNRSSMRWKTLRTINGKARWALTGTPLQNTVNDLGSLLCWIGAVTEVEDMAATKVKKDAAMVQRIQQAYKFYAIQRRAPEWVSITEEIIWITWDQSGLEAQLYTSILKEYAKVADMDDSVAANSVKVLTVIEKARQCCCSPGLLEHHRLKRALACEAYRGGEDADSGSEELVFDDNREEMITPDLLCCENYESLKLKKVVELLMSEKHASECKVIFTRWSHAITILSNILNAQTIRDGDQVSRRHPRSLFQTLDGKSTPKQRHEIVNDFQDGRFPILICNTTCTAQGINLQRASVVIMLNPDWNPCIEQQAICRVWRRGQTRPVTVYSLAVKNTVEEYIMNIQSAKAREIQQVIGTARVGEFRSYVENKSAESMEQIRSQWQVRGDMDDAFCSAVCCCSRKSFAQAKRISSINPSV